MNFRNILSRVKELVTVKKETRKYFVYVIIIIAILGAIGMAINRSTNAKLRANLVILETEKEEYSKMLLEAWTEVRGLQDAIDVQFGIVGDLHKEIDSASEEIEDLVLAREVERRSMESLETQLNEAHTDIAGSELKNSLIGMLVVEGLEAQFPEEDHVFFSKTQVDLFRTNTSTANLIYAVITENAIRIQLIENLGGQVTILTEQVGVAEIIIDLKDEEIVAMQIMNNEYQGTQESLEAALNQGSRYAKTLERQLALMRRKNLFERILPSLNIVIGPYYDPFKNTAGFGVALGLGWRF